MLTSIVPDWSPSNGPGDPLRKTALQYVLDSDVARNEIKAELDSE